MSHYDRHYSNIHGSKTACVTQKKSEPLVILSTVISSSVSKPDFRRSIHSSVTLGDVAGSSESSMSILVDYIAGNIIEKLSNTIFTKRFVSTHLPRHNKSTIRCVFIKGFTILHHGLSFRQPIRIFIFTIIIH